MSAFGEMTHKEIRTEIKWHINCPDVDVVRYTPKEVEDMIYGYLLKNTERFSK